MMAETVFLLQQMMIFSIPMLIVALGGMFAERGGIVNIALEGIMITGAFTGILFIYFIQGAEGGGSETGRHILLPALLISALSGVAAALPHAYASIHMKANQIISGTAINMFAPAFAIYAARTIRSVRQIPYRNVFFIEKIPGLGDIPLICPFLFQRTYITTHLGFLILAVSWAVLCKTPFGLRLRACGEYPQAADSAGISVYKTRFAGVLISGGLAGLGGLAFVIPTASTFDATVAGYGFLALAVLIFGQWKPWRILFAAFFFGMMKTVSVSYTSIGFLSGLPLPGAVYKMIPFVATLIVLSFTSRKSAAPRALGIPYEKESG